MNEEKILNKITPSSQILVILNPKKHGRNWLKAAFSGSLRFVAGNGTILDALMRHGHSIVEDCKSASFQRCITFICISVFNLPLSVFHCVF